MADTEIFWADNSDPKMIEAFQNAQKTFKYFWRELSWEYRRIIPALDLAFVKIAFTQEMERNNKPIVEHMWISKISFDGNNVTGVLNNKPNKLTNIRHGDVVNVPLSQISDWLFALKSKTYGGFTIQVMRSEMTNQQRKQHDDAWRLDFGDYNEILIVHEQKENPENLIEHPMSKNMREKLIVFLTENPNEITDSDEKGLTLLHHETIAGNLTSVEVLLSLGADKHLKSKQGETALDFAKKLDWEHIKQILER